MLRLAHADRLVLKALAAGSVPPEMRQLWNRMENMWSGSSLVRPRYARPWRTGYARSGVAASNAGRRPGFQRRPRDCSAIDRGRRRLPRGRRLSQYPGANAQTRLAGRDHFLGAFHESSDAQMGGSEWNFCVIGRFLRIDYLHGAVKARVRACTLARSRRVESVPPAHVTPPIQANTEDCTSDGQSLPATATARGGRCTHS